MPPFLSKSKMGKPSPFTLVNCGCFTSAFFALAIWGFGGREALACVFALRQAALCGYGRALLPDIGCLLECVG